MYKVAKSFNGNVDSKQLRGGWYFEKGKIVTEEFMGYALFHAAVKKGLITEVKGKGKK